VVAVAAPLPAAARLPDDSGHVAVSVVLTPIPVIPPPAAGDNEPQLGAPAQPPAPGNVQSPTCGSARRKRPCSRRSSAPSNKVRAARGLRLLRRSPLLSRAAVAHARALALAGDFQHEWPDGRPFGLWILRYYPLGVHTSWSSGENLLWTSGALNGAQRDPHVARQSGAPPEHARPALARDRRRRRARIAAGGAFTGYDIDLAATEFGTRS